ncbi:MAG: 2'-5' RNA ligase family protein [Caldilinea sp. CFX5]|nr:2'-5' RNA ligase family protein [Caldilinea sp. CFX5]
MPFAVHLFFDKEIEQRIIDVWQTLAVSDIAPYMYHSNNRPHLTLAIFKQVDVTAAIEQLQHFAQTIPPFPVTLSHFGLFHSTEGVIFVAPTVTAHLLEVHRQLHQHDSHFGQDSLSYYLPDRWVPHCSLALGVTPEKKLKAVELVHQLPLPLQGQIAQVGLIEFRPVKHLVHFSLSGG